MTGNSVRIIANIVSNSSFSIQLDFSACGSIFFSFVTWFKLVYIILYIYICNSYNTPARALSHIHTK